MIKPMFSMLARSTNWAMSRVVVNIIQKWVVVATVLLIDKGSYKAKKSWAFSKGSPKNLRALLRHKSEQRKQLRAARKKAKKAKVKKGVTVLGYKIQKQRG